MFYESLKDDVALAWFKNNNEIIHFDPSSGLLLENDDTNKPNFNNISGGVSAADNSMERNPERSTYLCCGHKKMKSDFRKFEYFKHKNFRFRCLQMHDIYSKGKWFLK